MAIASVEFDLSMVDPDTGLFNTARIYTVDGVNNVDGSPRELSIGQLVMAICLQRAAELEAAIIQKMEELENTSSNLEALTAIENEVLTWVEKYPSNSYREFDNDSYGGKTYQDILTELEVISYPVDGVRWSGTGDATDISYDDFIAALEAKMDEKNSFSQKTMIELQSLTSKRDQAYDMVSNVLKSLNTVLVGTVNNI